MAHDVRHVDTWLRVTNTFHPVIIENWLKFDLSRAIDWYISSGLPMGGMLTFKQKLGAHVQSNGVRQGGDCTPRRALTHGGRLLERDSVVPSQGCTESVAPGTAPGRPCTRA